MNDPDPAQPVRFTYTMTEADLLAWYRFIRKSMPSAARQRRRYLISFGCVYFGLAIIASAYLQSWQAVPFFLLGAAVATFLLPRSYARQVEQGLRAHAADPYLKGSLGKKELTISVAGLRAVGSTTELFVQWEGVGDVALDRDHLFIALTIGQGFVISQVSYSGPSPFPDLPNVIHDLRKGHEMGGVASSPVAG